MRDNAPAQVVVDDNEPIEPAWHKLFRLKIDRAIASDNWRRVINEMKTAQTLSLVNGHAVMRLVMFYVEFERASRDVAKSGVIRKAVKTKVPQVHPAWGVMKQAAAAAAGVEEELGISPRRRNNAGKVQRTERKARPADRFLKAVS
jgi:P27 family predicted phage terminase small subunit